MWFVWADALHHYMSNITSIFRETLVHTQDKNLKGLSALEERIMLGVAGRGAELSQTKG